jgi:hypothetical protein
MADRTQGTLSCDPAPEHDSPFADGDGDRSDPDDADPDDGQLTLGQSTNEDITDYGQ